MHLNRYSPCNCFLLNSLKLSTCFIYIQVEKLDDAMMFYLSSLPEDTFVILSKIFEMFSDADLKGQHVPRSKKGTTAKLPDLKGSQFKCLRNIEKDMVHTLLEEVSERKMSMKELSSECASIKLINKVQAAFVKGTNCTDWEDAVSKFPSFATAEQLEPYKNLDFSGSTLPKQFLSFCQRALAAVNPIAESTTQSMDSDSVFLIKHEKSVGIFWKNDIMTVNPDNLSQTLACSSVPFPGFALAVFDLPDGTSNDSWNTTVSG